MPEGPEVRRYAIDLSKAVTGRSLESIEIVSGRYTKKLPEGFEEFSSSLSLNILGTGVHGKFMYWLLEDTWSIWSTLGMTGAWSKKSSNHTRVKFLTNDSTVYYNDIRNFGTLKFVKGPKPLLNKLSKLGPDLLSEECPVGLFIQCLRKHNNKLIVQVLMDQSVVAGVGNYIKSDALWLSGISPHRKVCEITDQELLTLNTSIRDIMTTSFSSGGATIQTYTGFDGSKGEYGSRFLVYNRKVDPLGNNVIKEKTKDGRSTFWSPEKQS
ncbi:hypothetical protein OAA09_00755 [bacterium]|nr:hypothetical protein [bacterium]